jgi:hypothetical protein
MSVEKSANVKEQPKSPRKTGRRRFRPWRRALYLFWSTLEAHPARIFFAFYPTTPVYACDTYSTISLLIYNKILHGRYTHNTGNNSRRVEFPILARLRRGGGGVSMGD